MAASRSRGGSRGGGSAGRILFAASSAVPGLGYGSSGGGTVMTSSEASGPSTGGYGHQAPEPASSGAACDSPSPPLLALSTPKKRRTAFSIGSALASSEDVPSALGGGGREEEEAEERHWARSPLLAADGTGCSSPLGAASKTHRGQQGSSPAGR